MMGTYQILNVGDVVPLKTVLGNIYFMGVVTDPNVPNQFAATMEMFGDTAIVTVPVLQGPPGDKGDPMFALRFQNDSLDDVPDSEHLPTLTNTEADIGKYWIFKTLDSEGEVIGTTMYVWFGTEYRSMPVGSQGPPGPYPLIRPVIEAEPPGSHNGPNGEQNWITVEGGKESPLWTWHVAFPDGPQGIPGDALWSAGDVDLTGAEVGDILVMSADLNLSGKNIWKPQKPQLLVPQPYTVPESAFQSYVGVTGSSQTVCTFPVPQQTNAWKPWVFGQLRIFGFQLDATPLLLGAEVRLGNPTTGPVVAVGHGNAFGTVTLVPHASTSASPNLAMTPSNSYAKVAAGHTGTAGTLYVNLINEGFASAFDFDPEGAQVDVLALPVAT